MGKITFKKSFAAIAVSTILGMTSASAEDIKGTIAVVSGNPTDLTVKAVNQATGTTRTVELNADGSYRLAKLPSGQYDVTVAKGNTVLAQEVVRVSLGKNTITR